jgi:hypothetical protein
VGFYFGGVAAIEKRVETSIWCIYLLFKHQNTDKNTVKICNADDVAISRRYFIDIA